MELQRGDEIQVLDRDGHYLWDGVVTALNPNKKDKVHYIRTEGSVGTVKNTLVIKTGKRYRLDEFLENDSKEVKKVQVQLKLDNSEVEAVYQKAEKLRDVLKEASSLIKELANTEAKVKVNLPPRVEK